ncbi:hypothetical protein OQH60_01360 [Campylobacter sp. MIT 21-1685]|uniref:hypothetical protein n=1 Tax=unclassified Campylobacter TaxID=2593542 RepID=UPI00224A9531|nr:MULTISPECIES: hypothetical protein [unclassified Campylobacter]MCX2682524.1 hypothetical protein [Campylobacter sp. MIT 21-1684]MCX2750763.1 hypothetical protein [Campylobacter sp. MIT 21-1682]MCX2807005.1 hypothetical protein [Campylobacter sp. MIT 21-1685]
MKRNFIIKNSNSILNELMGKSHYKPLKNIFFCKDFIRLMLPDKRRLIAKAFITNTTFNIMTFHTTGYQELNHDDSKFSIKLLLKQYAQAYPLSEFSCIKEVKIFSQRYTSLKQEVAKTEKVFIELSLGKFKNPFRNENLAKKFEELRMLIKNG